MLSAANGEPSGTENEHNMDSGIIGRGLGFALMPEFEILQQT